MYVGSSITRFHIIWKNLDYEFAQIQALWFGPAASTVGPYGIKPRELHCSKVPTYIN